MDMMPDRYTDSGYTHRTWPTRLAGAGALLGCCLLLACLYTYNVSEVSWSLLNPHANETTASLPCTNLLGVCGMYIAGILYFLLGAGAIYGAYLAMAPACCMILSPEEPRTGQWISLVVMLLSACAFCSVQPWALIQWAQRLNLTTPGGKMGYLCGTCTGEALLGQTWAMALMLLTHGIALIYFAQLTPKSLYIYSKADLLECIRRYREKRSKTRRDKEAAQNAWQRPLDDPLPMQPSPVADRSYEPPPGHDYRQPTAPAMAPPSRQQALPLREADEDRDRLPPRDTPRPLPNRDEPQQAPQKYFKTSTPLPPETPYDTEPRERQRDLPRETPPSRATRENRAANRRSKSDNLLDLIRPVEEEIERKNSGMADDYEPIIPLNEHTQRAIDRRYGFEKEKQPEPAAPPTPQQPEREAMPRTAPPQPAPQPTLAPRSQEETVGDYPLPPYEMLNYKPVPPEMREAARAEMLNMQAIIADALESFRISVLPGEITRGPSVTRYEFSVPRGKSVKDVANKSQDIMAATKSCSVNILAPIPGKSTVGIELENKEKEPVYLRELLQSPEFHNPKVRIPVALGKDVYGRPVIGDLAAMPHVLVAGSTGSGKSVCINSMLVSMLYKFRPDELKLVLVDPKVVEMQPYKKLPHLAVPVVTDPARVIGALRWAVNEMERRYKYFSKMGVRNLEDFNNLPPDAQPIDDEPEEETNEPLDMRSADAIVRDIEDSQGIENIPEDEDEKQGEFDFEAGEAIPSRLPYIVIVIDELADLMMQVKEDLELYISRLTQKARAAGIHLIVATQSPRSQVVTGIIKANLPSRIALKVSSALDSRVILDECGAENLLGRGDLLFLPPGGPTKMARAQGAFVSDGEIASIIQFCAAHAKQSFVASAAAAINDTSPSPGNGKGGRGGNASGAPGGAVDEELYTRCVNLVVTERKASTTLLQRRFRIGYGKAAEIMELMEMRGVVAPATNSSRAREVLIDAPE